MKLTDEVFQKMSKRRQTMNRKCLELLQVMRRLGTAPPEVLCAETCQSRRVVARRILQLRSLYGVDIRWSWHDQSYVLLNGDEILQQEDGTPVTLLEEVKEEEVISWPSSRLTQDELHKRVRHLRTKGKKASESE